MLNLSEPNAEREQGVVQTGQGSLECVQWDLGHLRAPSVLIVLTVALHQN